MKTEIAKVISETIETEQKESASKIWQTPLIGFADAEDPNISKLKEWVSKKHLCPKDILPEAKSIIVYFIPFSSSVINSNKKEKNASAEWGNAYIKTNSIVEQINNNIKKFLYSQNYKCETTPATHNFNENELISNWSHRHIAYIAGLGTFGQNNMLITESGCCGRLGSCVTNFYFSPSPKPNSEFCLNKFNGTCKLCIKKCVNNSLSEENFDRFKCYKVCLKNNTNLSLNDIADICGKCTVGLPCSITNPVKKFIKNGNR